MGAFFIFRKPGPTCEADARGVFEKSGFSTPAEYRLGEWTLWQYRKVLVAQDNHLEGEGGVSVHACGTVVYRGLGYRASLHRLLEDFRAGRIDQEELIGSYCLLFWDGRTISILMDRSLTFHVFCNAEKTCISSSFLAVLAASPTSLPLNPLATSEKLATGYIMAPDTLIEGIWQVDRDVGAVYSPGEDRVSFLPVAPRPSVCAHRAGVADSIARQVASLKRHFQAMDALHGESHGELGLSSGYDSRLVLACSRFLSRPIDLHTHGTQGIHDAEGNIVRQMAVDRGLPLTQISTRRMEDHGPEEIASMLDDGLYFYDGRCSHNMGAFSEVYTRAYKTRVLGEHRLGWNGLGGEMYRNYYFTADRFVNLRQWLDRHVYYPFAAEALGRPVFEAMHLHKVEKMARRLGTPPSPRVDFQWLRRYYSEIRMPDCDAANNDACNRLAFFHTPFMDAVLVAEAMGATPYIGCDGAYQARLIREIEPALARYSTHYGHALERIPLSARVYSWLKCRTSASLQHMRMQVLLRRRSPAVLSEFHAFADRIPVLGEIREVLRSSILPDGFETAMIHYAQRPTTLFVGSFLRAFQHKIRW